MKGILAGTRGQEQGVTITDENALAVVQKGDRQVASRTASQSRTTGDHANVPDPVEA